MDNTQRARHCINNNDNNAWFHYYVMVDRRVSVCSQQKGFLARLNSAAWGLFAFHRSLSAKWIRACNNIESIRRFIQNTNRHYAASHLRIVFLMRLTRYSNNTLTSLHYTLLSKNLHAKFKQSQNILCCRCHQKWARKKFNSIGFPFLMSWSLWKCNSPSLIYL